VGRIEGISEQQQASLAAFETSDAFTEPEKLRYAEALTQTPANVAEK